jgi:hypothetical protein
VLTEEEKKRRKAAGEKAYRIANREKLAAKQLARHQADPEAYKAWWRTYNAGRKEKLRESLWKRKYGITRADYDGMLASQGGHCAVCPKTEPGGRGKYFHVDHDHQTGKIRGLLCFEHNTALRNMDQMRALMAYAGLAQLVSAPAEDLR